MSKKKAVLENLPTSDQALPFYGVDNGTVSLRGGGAAVMLEMDGFDYETSNPSSISALGQALTDAVKAVSKIGGVATSGVAVSYTVLQRRLDLADLISHTRRASLKAEETGIAAFARTEEEYLQALASQNPFICRRYFIGISLDKKAFQAELDEAQENGQTDTTLHQEFLTDAGMDGKDDAPGSRPARPGYWEQFKKNWEDTFEGGAAARSAFSSAATGIQLNPVPPALAATLRQKAEIFATALRPFGLEAHRLNSCQVAEVLAELMRLPTHSTEPLEIALEREAKKVKGQTLPQAESLFNPPGGNEWGALDATSFGYSAIEFQSKYTRIGLPPSLARQMAQFNTSGANKQALKNGGLSLADGTFISLPTHTYINTLYSTAWPRSMTMGVLFPLITQPDLEMNLTVQLVPIPKRKAQSKLERQRINLEVMQEADQSNRAYYDRREQAAAIEELQTQIATDEGSLIMAGLRIAVLAETPYLLERHAKNVASVLSGVGITVTPSLYNQALALYSTLPLGRDFLREAPLFGKRTVRNMTGLTASCLFPALVPEQSDAQGVFVGRGAYGGLTMISTDKLLAPHGVTYGASGAGKTVSKQLDIGRRLTADLNLSVMYIDPQGVLAKLAVELGGEVMDMSAEAERKVRLNFLDRFIMAGRPMPFADLSTVFTTFLALMQSQQLSSNEKTAVTSALKGLVKHFELGDSVTPLLVAGLKARYYDALGFGDPETAELMEETLENIYQALRETYAIPTHGYLVQVVRNVQSGGVVVKHSSEEKALLYRSSRGKDKAGAEDAAVELKVLVTTTRGGRNYYAGEGETLIQIPLGAYDRLLKSVTSRRGGGELDYGSWLSLALVSYLCSGQPRRLTGTSQWLLPEIFTDARGLKRCVSDPNIPGTNLVVDAGPCWYAEDGWSEEVAMDFAEHFAECGLFTALNREDTGRVLRDLLVELKHGIPILSDLLPVLAADAYGLDLVNNLEMFCDPDITGALFNGHTNVNLYNRFIVFDVKNVTDELRPLRMLQCMQLSWRLITSNQVQSGKHFLFVVDEFGVIANQAPEVAAYVGILYKRSRAFGCAMWLIDQDASSLQSLAGRHAISNAGIVEIMRQDMQDLGYWQSMFGLSQEEVDMIANFGPGQVMILLREPSRTRKVLARYTMSASQLKLLSTRQADVRQFIAEQQQAKGLTADPMAELLDGLMGHSFVA